MKAPKDVHVIDDEPGVLTWAEIVLEENGFHPQTYASADEFLQKVRPDIAGCVVTDIRMPGLSGLEFIANLNERGFALPIIVITAYADTALAVQAMKQGAIDLLRKPFSSDVFLATIRRALSRQINVRASPEVVRARLLTLTPEEDEVFARLLRALSKDRIAKDLGLSAGDVENHIENILSKMQTDSMADVITAAQTPLPDRRT